MDKRGLRDSIGVPKKLLIKFKVIMDFLMCTDGSDLLNISKKLNLNIFDSNEIIELLIKEC